MAVTSRPRSRPPTLTTQVTEAVLGWFDERVPLRRLLARVLSDPVPKQFAWLYTFGGVILYLFAIQLLTGIMLTFHYIPSWNAAYNSIQFIDHTILLGNLIRGIHYWNAYMILFVIGIHMGRTFSAAATKSRAN